MIALLLSVASGHTGIARVRTGPEASDIALFLLAVLAVWFVRRRLRARFRNRPDGRGAQGQGPYRRD